jgi:hypothetical protein
MSVIVSVRSALLACLKNTLYAGLYAHNASQLHGRYKRLGMCGYAIFHGEHIHQFGFWREWN